MLIRKVFLMARGGRNIFCTHSNAAMCLLTPSHSDVFFPPAGRICYTLPPSLTKNYSSKLTNILYKTAKLYSIYTTHSNFRIIFCLIYI